MSDATRKTSSGRSTRSATRRPARRDRAAADRAVCEVQCVDGAAVARARSVMPPEPAVAIAAATFRMLGDPTRLRIAHALSGEELCVCDLATVLGMSQSVISHSLRALRLLRIVKYRKAGKIAYYSLDDAHIATLVAGALDHAEEAR